MAVNQRSDAAWARRPDVRIGAVVAIAVAVAFVVWLIVRNNDSGSWSKPGTTTVQEIAPVGASESRLRSLSVDVGRPVYWLGPRSNNTYELSRTAQDRIYVRYLPHDAAVGTKLEYPFVGTYPVRGAYKVLKSLAKTSGETSFTTPKNGIAVYSDSHPTNVYVAFPDSDVQIEVFDPSAGRAREVVASGRVVPVG